MDGAQGPLEITTEREFDAFIGQGVVIVNFHRAWCGPCKLFDPLFREVAGEHPLLRFGMVSTDDNPSLIDRYGLVGLPTVAAYQGGTLAEKRFGRMSKQGLTEFVEAYERLLP